MTQKASRTRVLRLAAATAFLVVLSVGAANPALANTSGSITSSVNSSDPELIRCPNSAGTGMTLCLFTSQDMGDGSVPSIPYGQNYYPMKQTMLWRLKDGQDASKPANWVNQGAVIQESSLYGQGVPSNAYHLWAPGVKYLDNQYYLYVPDVLNVNLESTTSRIFMFTSTNPTGAGGFTFRGMMDNYQDEPNNGYASDPNLFVDTNNVRYMVYANGDASNCGDLSMGRLSITMWTYYSRPQRIGINGWGDNLGTCGGTGHPYLEGPALYLSSELGAPSTNPKYTLIFAAKPTSTPTGCTNTSNEVIAYATSNTVTGPYNYKGIIMCGSTSEWTNQASVVQSTNVSYKYLFAWHDGGNSFHNRRTHLMCLRWDSAGKAVQIPRSSSNLSNCP